MSNKYQFQIKANLKNNILWLFPDWIICLLVVFVVLVVFPNKASAASLSLGIDPPILQIEAKAPAVINTPLTIRNLNTEEIALKIVLKSFRDSETEDGQITYVEDKETLAKLSERVKILDGDRAIEDLTLAPSQQKKLSLFIDIPKDEPSLDYYFSVTFLSKVDQKDQERTQTQASGGISTLVLLSINPKGKPDGEIEEFSAPFFLEKGPVPFTVRIKNTSNRYITPLGSILIRNMFGQTVGRVDLTPVNILPSTIRAVPDLPLETSSTSSSNLEFIQEESPKAFWREPFLLGLYTASLTVALSDQGPVFTRTVNFIGFPVQIFVGVLVAILLVLFIRDRLKKHID